MSAILIGVGLLLVVLGVVGVVIYFKLNQVTRLADAWKPLPPPYERTLAIVAPPQTPENVREALALAQAYLALNGPWKAKEIVAVVETLSVVVNASNDWVDSAGRKVGGQEYFRTVAVGQDLSALCHELAHVCEFVLVGRVDVDHVTWAANGITKADEAYRNALVKK